MTKAQGIFIDLKIEKMPRFIVRYSKAEMEQIVRDSISSGLKRRKERIERQITFNPAEEHEYIVELILTDTVDIEAPARYKSVRLATIYSRVYEKGLEAALIPQLKWFAVGYSDQYGNLHPGQTEANVLGDYGKWTTIILSTDCLVQIPYMKTHALSEFNISQKDVETFTIFKEVLITKTNFDNSKQAAIINRLLNDVLLRQQQFYYRTRSKKSNYINIYDSYNETFTDHPLNVELVLDYKDDGFKIRLVIDKSLTTQHSNYHVPMEIEFSNEQLEHAPTQVMNKMHDVFEKLFRLNLE